MYCRNHVRRISSFFIAMLIIIAVCGFALASTSGKQTAQGTGTASLPVSSRPVSSVHVSSSILPVIASISPSSGREGDTITITSTTAAFGGGFGATQGTGHVNMNGLLDKVTTYTSWSDTKIVCVVPKITTLIGYPILVFPQVVNSNGISSVNALVTFNVLAPRPTVTTIVPPGWVASASASSNAKVVIMGTNFRAGATVALKQAASDGGGTLTVSGVTVSSSTLITATATIPKWANVPRPSGVADVPPFAATVTNPDGGQGTGGSYIIMRNPCGSGAAASVAGVGLMLGIMTLAGTLHDRKRRSKKA